MIYFLFYTAAGDTDPLLSSLFHRLKTVAKSSLSPLEGPLGQFEANQLLFHCPYQGEGCRQQIRQKDGFWAIWVPLVGNQDLHNGGGVHCVNWPIKKLFYWDKNVSLFNLCGTGEGP